MYLNDGKPVNRAGYEWKSHSITVAGVLADTNLKDIAAFSTVFDTVKEAHHIVLESNGAIYICLNAITNDIITVNTTTPYEDTEAVVSRIFVSTGGNPITLTVKLK